jgi:hypothetical protein
VIFPYFIANDGKFPTPYFVLKYQLLRK